MAYAVDVEDKLKVKLQKLSKSNHSVHEQVLKKVNQLCINPRIGKPLKGKYNGVRRVHIGNMVLTYKINDIFRRIVLIDFVHHDVAYR